MNRFYPYLLFLATFLPYRYLSAQDIIKLADGTATEGKIELLGKDLVTYTRADNGQQVAVPALELKWIKRDKFTIAIYPANNADQEIQLTTDELKEVVNDEEYGVLLHAFTVMEDAIFATGRTDLTATSRSKLIPFIKFLASQKNLLYEVSVHTDNSGEAAANLAISERRANSLKALFTGQGVSPDQIKFTGKGMEEPLYLEKDQQIKNRRVELRISEIKDTEVLYAEEYVPPAIEEEAEDDIRTETQPSLAKEEGIPQAKTSSSSSAVEKKRGHKGFTFTIGARMDQILGGKSNAWSSKSGIGLQRSLGGDINLNYRLGNVFGLLLNTGFLQSSVLKEYVTEEISQYSTRETLRQIPLQVGIRIYVLKNVYLQATGGGQYLQMVYSSLGSDIFGYDTYTSSAIKPGYGGGLGYELQLGNFLIDITGQYNSLLSDGFYGSSAAMPTVGLRAGIGFDFKK